jgi:hypothetical protein
MFTPAECEAIRNFHLRERTRERQKHLARWIIRCAILLGIAWYFLMQGL